MSKAKPKNPAPGAGRRQPEADTAASPIVCPRCGGPIVSGQHVPPLFAAKLVRWSEHPVLSRPLVFRGFIPKNGSPATVDLSFEDQLIQRAAMGGERERAELAAFDAIFSECLANALAAKVKEEAAVEGVDVVAWLKRRCGSRAG